MTYYQLIDVLKNLEKKDTLLLVDDQFPVEARLGYITMSMTRYDNGKIVETRPDIRVNGIPVEDIQETNYLTIISTPSNHGRYSRPNTLDIPPIANEWVKYLEKLPNIFLQQELMFYGRSKDYGANQIAAMKGGIGFSLIGVVHDEKTGRTEISSSANERKDQDFVTRCSRDYNVKPYYWREAIIFDMTRESYYNDRAIYNPYNPENPDL